MSDSRLSVAKSEAANWLVRRDAGLSAADEHRLRHWLAASPTNLEAWELAKVAWESFDTPPDDLTAVMRAQALSAGPRARNNHWRALMAAGFACAAVLAGLAAWRLLPQRALGPQTVATVETITTTAGQRATRQLSDGTRVTLDAKTVLETKFDGHARQVRLVSGQAYFDVVQDKARPFAVAAGDRMISDIGTRFSVRRQETGELTIVLEQGSVSVGGAGETRVLRPGDRLRALPHQTGLLDQVDTAVALSWREGFLEFRNTSLGDAVAQMNSYGGKPIVLADAATAQLRISGRFRSDDPYGFTQAVVALAPVQAQTTGAGLRLSKRH